MRAVYGIVWLLFLSALLSAQQPPDKTKSYMHYGLVQRHGGSATVLANDPRPLLQAITAVKEEYGWIVDFEDPPFTSHQDLIHNADPQWAGAPRANARGVTVLAGGPFQSDYPEGPDLTSTAAKEAVLQKIITDYNRSGNPGKFRLVDEGGGRYAIVGAQVKDGGGGDRPATAILDTPISIPSETRSGYQTVRVVVDALSDASGVKVHLGLLADNVLYPSRVTAGGANIRARDLLLQTLNATQYAMDWQLLFDAGGRAYYLSILGASRVIQDPSGERIKVGIGYPGRTRPPRPR